MNATLTAVITNDPYFDPIARVERRRWRVSLSDGRRKFVGTRREAQEWCDDMRITWTLA